MNSESYKPYLIEAAPAHAKKTVWYEARSNIAHVLLPNGAEQVVPLDHQYDLTQATLFGLNERLTLAATSPLVGADGKTLRDEFNEEWERYQEAMLSDDGLLSYGWYVYYPERNDLVRFSPPYWHRIVAVASSSKLLADPEKRLSWKEIQEIFTTTTVAVAGCSVGSNVAHAVAMDLRPRCLKLADKSLYKMENINRVRLGYNEIVKHNAARSSIMDLALQNKTETVAKQIYSIDPFISIAVYSEGIQEANIQRFLEGEKNEPKADIVVEEVDDPKVKLFIREECRKRRIPVVMVTDVGSSVQLDVLRYDQDPALPLAYGTSDESLRARTTAVYDDPGNRKVFFEFVDALIGTDYRQDELKNILEGKSEIPTSTIIPQLGSTAQAAGAIAAEAVARIRLGHTYPPRMIWNKQTFEVKKYF